MAVVYNLGKVVGADGKSAYEIAVDKGFEGTEEQWLESLKGEDGKSGADGKSSYEIALENGFVGTEEEWIASQKGERGVGIFYMRINENGELIMGAADEESKPPLSIDEDGNLIYTV